MLLVQNRCDLRKDFAPESRVGWSKRGGTCADDSMIIAFVNQVHPCSDFSVGAHECFALSNEWSNLAAVNEHHVPIADL